MRTGPPRADALHRGGRSVRRVSGLPGPQSGDLFSVGRPGVLRITVYGYPGSLQNLWNVQEVRVVDDAVERVKADAAVADIFMPVLSGAAGIFAVVDMEDSDLVLSKDPVEVV